MKREPGLFDGGILWILFGEFERRVEQGVLKQSDHLGDLGLKTLSADDGIERDFTRGRFDLLGLFGLHLVGARRGRERKHANARMAHQRAGAVEIRCQHIDARAKLALLLFLGRR